MKSFFLILSALFLRISIADASPYNQNAAIQEKVLICGVCKNVEKAFMNTMQSSANLGAQFLDYKVVIYENNSSDRTKSLYMEWAKRDPHVLFMCEDVSDRVLAKQLHMGVLNRTELIARARNKVLDEIMQGKYDDFKYVVMADLDFEEPWDVDAIVDTILCPQEEWDAVLSYGFYDLYALRDAQFPIGPELVGMYYWDKILEIHYQFILDPNSPWRKVYSAFGGIGIYKRESIKGCRYSGVVTKDMEEVVQGWLKVARESEQKICFLDEYERLLATAPVYDLFSPRFSNQDMRPKVFGVSMNNAFGRGKVVWFGCIHGDTLPTTCEHVALHSSMALQGHSKIFLNPRWRSRRTE